MHRLSYACLETAIAAVFLIPIFYYYHKTKFHSKRTTIVALLFSLYLCAVYSMVGLPNATYFRFRPNYNIVPFRYFFSDFTSLLNVFLFIPLGFFLPVLREKFRKFIPVLLFGFLMSVLIEVMQIFTLRATDINDLMTNTLGTILGYFVGKLLLRTFPELILPEETQELRTICVTTVLVMFFLHPFLSGAIWTQFLK